jgi:hypothetical protein
MIVLDDGPHGGYQELVKEGFSAPPFFTYRGEFYERFDVEETPGGARHRYRHLGKDPFWLG